MMTRGLQLSMKDFHPSAREERSVYDLSDDNLSEIFLRLPVRSLLSCQCVCKRFSKVIANPKFIDTHANQGITSNTTSFCSVSLCGNDETDECTSNETDKCASYEFGEHRYDDILLENADRSVSFSYVRLSNPISCKITIVGSCNGLLCAELEASEDQDEAYMLIWNPVTRENRYVAKPKINASRYETPLALAFGFTPGTNDYKVVRIICLCSFKEPLQRTGGVLVIKVEVYSMSTDSWSTYKLKTLQCREIDYMHPRVDPIILLGIDCPPITQSVRGAFHWLCNAPGYASRIAKAILSFDLQEEQLRLFTVLDSRKIPFVEAGKLDCLNDSLSMIVPHYLSPYSPFDIWVMNDYGDRKSWIKQFTVDQFRSLARPIGYWKDDLFLMAKTIMEDRFLCLYNLKSQEMKFFPITWQFISPSVCDYVETFQKISRAIATTGEAV